MCVMRRIISGANGVYAGARMPMIISGAKWLRRVGSRDVCDA